MLKDHEVRELINAVTKGLQAKLPHLKFPQCLRIIIHDIIIEYLNKNNLRQ